MSPGPAGSGVLLLPPSPTLADRVLFYVARRPGAEPAGDWLARFPANLYSTLSFVHAGELHDAATGAALAPIVFSGLMSRPVQRRYVARPETTVVVLRPGALTDLVHLPAHEFSDAWVDAAALLPLAQHAALVDGVLAQRSVARRIHALEAFLARRFALARGPAARMAETLQSLVWELPHLNVDELADRFGSHRRALQRRFRDTFGAPPRFVSRLARLQLALWHLQRRARIADAARLAGYADAAHLSRDAGTLAGLTPARLRALLHDAAPGSSSWVFSAPQDALNPRSDPA